jgi:hypothetical protein
MNAADTYFAGTREAALDRGTTGVTYDSAEQLEAVGSSRGLWHSAGAMNAAGYEAGFIGGYEARIDAGGRDRNVKPTVPTRD